MVGFVSHTPSAQPGTRLPFQGMWTDEHHPRRATGDSGSLPPKDALALRYRTRCVGSRLEPSLWSSLVSHQRKVCGHFEELCLLICGHLKLRFPFSRVLTRAPQELDHSGNCIPNRASCKPNEATSMHCQRFMIPLNCPQHPFPG